jgi:hypothetical protein
MQRQKNDLSWLAWVKQNCSTCNTRYLPKDTLHGLALLIVLGYTLQTSMIRARVSPLWHYLPSSLTSCEFIKNDSFHSSVETWNLKSLLPGRPSRAKKGENSFHKLWNVVHESPTVNLDSLLLMLNLQNFDCSKYPPWPCLFFHVAEEATSFLSQQMELPIAKRNKCKSIAFNT